MYLIASVCFCAAENCWAKLSTASPKRPVCDIGTFRNCTFSCSFMSVRHSPRWRSWATSVDIALPRDCAVTFVARSARCTQDAAHVEPPGHDHPRAGLSVLWPDGPAVTPWRVGQKPHPHRLYKHCQLGLMNIYRPMRGDTVHPAEWKQLLNIVAWPKTAPQKGYLCTPKWLRHQGWWGGGESQDLFQAVKGAFHDLVSSSCTSGKNGTGGGSQRDPTEKPTMIACQCPLARLVTLEVDRSLWRDPSFVGHPT